MALVADDVGADLDLPVADVVHEVLGAAKHCGSVEDAVAVFLFLTYLISETLGISPMATALAFLPMVAMLIVGASVSAASLRLTPPSR